MISSICTLLARGALISMAVVILVLPAAFTPKVGDTITATYADDVKYIDSRTGELRTEDTPEEYRQKKLYGARDVEYTVCALVELPNSMSYRYSGVGYDAVLSVDTAQRDMMFLK